MSEQPVRQPNNRPSASTIARRKALRRKRMIKKRLILGGMIAAVILVIVLLIVLLVNIFGVTFAEETTLTVKSDGSIVMDEVEDFDKSTYDESELEKYTQDLVDEYNEHGNVGKVKFKKAKVKDGKAYLRMEYSDYNAYKLFTGNELFVGTVGEAKAAGYDFQDTFSKVSEAKKSEAVSVEDVTADDAKKVILIRANEHVVSPKDIKIISDACTTIVKKDEVAIAQPDGNKDATVLTTIIYE